jgi:uncharacterized alpha-E superfamily protein
MMLSRVSDSLYWMSRYLERAEHTARLIGVQWNLMLDQGPADSFARWQRVLKQLDAVMPDATPNDPFGVARGLVFDLACRSSIVSSIVSARENAQQVREQISSEMWEQLNRLFHEVKRASLNEEWDAEPMDFLRTVRNGCYLFQGLSDTTISHGEGWQFIQAGRGLERAIASSNMLRIHLADAAIQNDPLEWAGLLRNCQAFEAYCKVYTAELRPEWIVEFLLLSEDFPHSIRFCVDRVLGALGAIGRSLPAHRAAPVDRLTGRLQSILRYADVREIQTGGWEPFLRDLIRQAVLIHNAVHQVYIYYPVEAALED